MQEVNKKDVVKAYHCVPKLLTSTANYILTKESGKYISEKQK